MWHRYDNPIYRPTKLSPSKTISQEYCANVRIFNGITPQLLPKFQRWLLFRSQTPQLKLYAEMRKMFSTLRDSVVQGKTVSIFNKRFL